MTSRVIEEAQRAQRMVEAAIRQTREELRGKNEAEKAKKVLNARKKLLYSFAIGQMRLEEDGHSHTNPQGTLSLLVFSMLKRTQFNEDSILRLIDGMIKKGSFKGRQVSVHLSGVSATQLQCIIDMVAESGFTLSSPLEIKFLEMLSD